MLANTTLIARASQFDSLLQSSVFSGCDGNECILDVGTNQAIQILLEAKKASGNIYIVGNGGSAAVASHIMNDFQNVAELRATTMHEPAVLTCFTNDYGYENAYSVQLKKMATDKDVLIAISSSGQSANIVNAAKMLRDIGGKVITLSGFSKDNPLRQVGDLNFWVDSDEYGIVEIAHLFVLHHWSDQMGMLIMDNSYANQKSISSF